MVPAAELLNDENGVGEWEIELASNGFVVSVSAILDQLSTI